MLSFAAKVFVEIPQWNL